MCPADRPASDAARNHGSLFWFVHEWRLRLAGWIMPRGYAIWSWGGYLHEDDLDQLVIAKDGPDA